MEVDSPSVRTMLTSQTDELDSECSEPRTRAPAKAPDCVKLDLGFFQVGGAWL